MIPAISLLIFSIVLGFFEGTVKVSTLLLHATGLAILLVSNGIANLPFYTSDSGTWLRAYLTGFLETGVVSILVHVLPFYLTYIIVAKKG